MTIMKNALLASLLLAFGLSSQIATAQDTHAQPKPAMGMGMGMEKAPMPMHKDGAKPPMGMGMGMENPPMDMEKQMPKVQANMEKMQQQMEKIKRTTDPKERSRLLDEHMQTMQQNMQSMRVMQGPALKGSGKSAANGATTADPMKKRQDAMETRSADSATPHVIGRPCSWRKLLLRRTSQRELLLDLS